MKEEEKTYGERIKEEISAEKTVTIPISFPRNSYKRFKHWAHDNASGCFWLAIDKLVEADKQKLDISHEFRMLADRDEALLSEINRLQQEMNNLKNSDSDSSGKRTFGRKEEEKEK